MIKNIIFDFDGVLVDSEIIAGKAISNHLATLNIEFTEKEYSSIYAGNKTLNVIEDLSKKFKIKNKEVFFQEVMLIANNIYNNQLTPTNGIEELLNTIQQKKFIGSNSQRDRIVKGLKKVNLNKYFSYDSIFSFDMVKRPKPFPDVYNKAIEVTGIERDKTIIIEDSVVGVQSGIAANMKVIGLTSGGHWVGRSSKILLKNGAYAIANSGKELINIISKS